LLARWQRADAALEGAQLAGMRYGLSFADERCEMTEKLYSESELRELIERAIKMAWKVGSEGGSAGSITYEDVMSGTDYD
jgi:hypothetical protein